MGESGREPCKKCGKVHGVTKTTHVSRDELLSMAAEGHRKVTMMLDDTVITVQVGDEDRDEMVVVDGRKTRVITVTSDEAMVAKLAEVDAVVRESLLDGERMDMVNIRLDMLDKRALGAIQAMSEVTEDRQEMWAMLTLAAVHAGGLAGTRPGVMAQFIADIWPSAEEAQQYLVRQYALAEKRSGKGGSVH